MPEIGDVLPVTIPVTNTGTYNLISASFKVTFQNMAFFSLDSVSGGSYDEISHIWALPNILPAGVETLGLSLQITGEEYGLTVTEVQSRINPVTYSAIVTSSTPPTQSEVDDAIEGVVPSNFLMKVVPVTGTALELKTNVLAALVTTMGTDGLSTQTFTNHMTLDSEAIIFSNSGTEYALRLTSGGVLDVRRTSGTLVGNFTIFGILILNL